MSGLFTFGEEEEKKYGELVSKELKGMKISKRIDLADKPKGIRHEANKLGIDTWDLLSALEGMCAKGTAKEIDDSTYYVM